MDHPLYAHTLEKLRMAKQMEEEEALDGTLIRAGHRRRPRDVDQVTPRFSDRATNIDWWAPSPLVAFDRNTTNFRIPTLLLTPISKVAVPRGPYGQTHPSYPDPQASIENHYGYIERQERAAKSALGHGDYIEREEARETDDLGDVSHVCTNIHRNPEKRRAFARAVYRHERLGKKHELRAATDDLPWWEQRAAEPGAPDWVKQCYRTLKKKTSEHARKAAKSGKSAAPIYVSVLKTTERQAFDRITWCEGQPGWNASRHNLVFKSAPGGRVQYRFVYQLPYWITPAERMENVRKIARYLGKLGFMYVAAIHRPDPHNDPRNYHVHIDAYDRPCRFIKRLGLWDFEVAKKKRNGKISYPLRQNKIADFARSDSGLGHRAHGQQVVAALRETFCDFTNEVLERSELPLRYHPGPFEEIGLKLRATKKLGGKAMASEAIGLRTAVGDDNAVKIWSDVFDATHRDRELAVERVRSWSAQTAISLARVADYSEQDELKKDVAKAVKDELALIERRYRLELASAEVRMLRSRAETVEREVKRRGAAKAASGAFKKSGLNQVREAALRDARRHLSLIDKLSPEPAQVEAEMAVTSTSQKQLEARRSVLADEIARAMDPAESPAILGIRRRGTTTVAVDLGRPLQQVVFEGMSQFEQLEINRLLAWFKKTGSEIDRYEFGQSEMSLRAPKAVCTRLLKHWGRPEVMTVLQTCMEVAKKSQEAEAAGHIKNGSFYFRAPSERDTRKANIAHIGKRPGAHEILKRLSKGPADSANRIVSQPQSGQQATYSLNKVKPVPLSSSSPKSAAPVLAVKDLTRPMTESAGANASSTTEGRAPDQSATVQPLADQIKPSPGPEEVVMQSERIQIDEGFIAKERAAGLSVDGGNLRFWRKVMTGEVLPMWAAPRASGERFAIYLRDEPVSRAILSRRLEGVNNDPQLSRYLSAMFPVMPTLPPGEIDPVSLSVPLRMPASSQNDISADFLVEAARQKSLER